MSDAADRPLAELGTSLAEAAHHHGTGSWGWQCEDCTFFTYDDKGAESHSDNFRHSLARCPSERRRDQIKPDLTPVIEATKAFAVENRLRSVTAVTDTHVIQVTEPSVWAENHELELEVREIDL